MTSVALYLCPQTVASSLALANDAFQAANLHAGRELFRLLKVSVDGAAVPSTLGSLNVDGDLALAAQADILLLPAIGARVDVALAHNQPLLDWLRQPAPQNRMKIGGWPGTSLRSGSKLPPTRVSCQPGMKSQVWSVPSTKYVRNDVPATRRRSASSPSR